MTKALDDSLTRAIDEIQVLVSGDGARLDLLEPVTDKQVRFRLDLSDVGCADCLLPAAALSEIAAQSVRTHTGDDAYSVEIIDPREDG